METKTIEFEKKGMKFFIRNPELDKYNNLTFEYKIDKVKENSTNDGYFYNAIFRKEKNMLEIHFELNGQKVEGVLLPDEIAKEINKIYDEFKQERENKINKIVDELIEGKRNIHFSVVGVDYKHYQPWLINLPSDLDGLEQEIMEKAVEKLINKKPLVNICDYLERVLNKDIGTLEELGDVLNPKFDTKNQKIVISFEMKLIDILKQVLKKKEEEKKRIENIFELAKKTNQPQILEKWTEECNDENLDCDIDTVIVYAMPDGSRKVERIHNF